MAKRKSSRKKTRKFSGSTFRHKRATSKKAEANKTKTNIKKDGKKARITDRKKRGGGKMYDVWEGPKAKR